MASGDVGGAAPLTLRRLWRGATAFALALATCSALGQTAATVVAGRLAAAPSASLVAVLAVLVLGAEVFDTVGRTSAATVIGRAEGVLRADLLDAALHQPLATLEEQAVGEILDRVDDDTREVSVLMRRTGWNVVGSALRSVLAWVVAGLTWWPAWIAFPAVAALAFGVVRGRTRAVSAAKLAEEESWSEHAAQLEEVVAGRDDVRSSLGQPHVVRQYVLRGREVLDRTRVTCAASVAVALRSSLVLHAMLAALAVAGVALVSSGHLDIAELVTLWLLVTAFAGEISEVSNHLPEVQAGLGALTRIGQMLGAPREPRGGARVPPGALDVAFDDLTVAYPGGFALRGITLHVPAGTTCALVGRSGAGKSTLAKLVSRAIEPPPGTVRVGGLDVTATAIDDLRSAVGVVTQRTEVLAATLEENITLFAAVPTSSVAAAIEALGLESWVAALPDGLATRLGPGGLTLSSGEEQLVAFARLLVRDVRVVVLDEATARMDPVTEARVTRAADHLLAGRTGIVIAHRLSTTARAEAVGVLEAGRLVQHGPRAQLASQPGPFADLLAAAGPQAEAGEVPVRPPPVPVPVVPAQRAAPAAAPAAAPSASVGEPEPPVSLARTVVRLLLTHPSWGVVGAVGFGAATILGVYGASTGWMWGQLVASLEAGGHPWGWAAGVAASLLLAPFAIALAFRLYPLWWTEVTLRVRLAVLRGQTMQRRLPRTPPGEVAARALDSDRLIMYTDRWIDVAAGVVVVAATAVAGRSLLAGALIAAVLVTCAAASGLGAPLAGRWGRRAADARARFGRSLVSALDAARTIKLAAATDAVQGHLRAVDAERIHATLRENRVRALLEGVPGVLVQAVVVASWSAHLAGVFSLATTLLVTTAVVSCRWFGTVAGNAVAEAPVARAWLRSASALAGSTDLVRQPPGVDVVAGTAPPPAIAGRVPLTRLQLRGVDAVHDDGTVGVAGVDLTIEAGSLTLLLGQVGAGKSSLLGALAGLVDHTGRISWNDEQVTDPQLFLRPGQVAYVGQVPRVLSGTFRDNVTLDHDRGVAVALDDARMTRDVADAGGHTAIVGHRGTRLSGGQVQRLALARALATGAELLVADDVSSALDSRTEAELWIALRERGTTVIGSTSKRSTLSRADQVVVLDSGRVVASGRWPDLAERWGHLAG